MYFLNKQKKEPGFIPKIQIQQPCTGDLDKQLADGILLLNSSTEAENWQYSLSPHMRFWAENPGPIPCVLSRSTLTLCFFPALLLSVAIKQYARCEIYPLWALQGNVLRWRVSQSNGGNLAQLLSKLNVKNLEKRITVMSQDWSQILVTSHFIWTAGPLYMDIYSIPACYEICEIHSKIKYWSLSKN